MGRKHVIIICIAAAVLLSITMIVFVSPMLEKKKYEEIFGLDFEQITVFPHTPDWVRADAMPKYVDMGLTYFAYIWDEERPSQETIDSVFELLADEIGDADERTYITLTGDLREAVIDIHNNPLVVSGLYEASAGFISANVHEVIFSNRVNNVAINTYYSIEGKVTRNVTYANNGIVYIVTVTSNDSISNLSGSKIVHK